MLNFEDPAQFTPEQLAALVRAAGGWRLRWLAQEIRPLPGSETALHGRLPADCQGLAPLAVPGYARAGSARALLSCWEGLGSLFVSRYHALLVGAWMHARVSVFARNDKVAGAARQLGLPTVAGLAHPEEILRAVDAARPVPRGVFAGPCGGGA